jgi:hypothetical protein
MKTLITALTAVALLTGVGAANALDQQTTAAEIDNAANHEFTASGPYASARMPGHVVSSSQDFQAQGSN